MVSSCTCVDVGLVHDIFLYDADPDAPSFGGAMDL
jgi:hypothetical protein